MSRGSRPEGQGAEDRKLPLDLAAGSSPLTQEEQLPGATGAEARWQFTEEELRGGPGNEGPSGNVS